jgi:ferredoxin-NADP reductase/ferredoxin
MENSIIVIGMAVPAASEAPPAGGGGVARDHGFHRLRVARVVRETPDAASFVLEVPPELGGAFAYQAGQFCTFRATVGDRQHFRCYSMSSSPAVDGELQVTVKRVPGGLVSNWMVDGLAEGSVVEASCPAGVFCLAPTDRDLFAFAGGSGITPVFSLLKTALATTARRTHLLYANRDRGSVIFGAGLDRLVADHGHRLRVAHHFDTDSGFATEDEVRAFLGGATDADCYICGPQPFMDVVERALRAEGVPEDRVHIERFTPPATSDLAAGGAPPGPPVPSAPPAARSTPAPRAAPAAAPVPAPAAAPAPEPAAAPGPELAAAPGPELAATAVTAEVTVEVDGRTGSVAHRAGTTILQAARQLGLSPPSSCEAGNCATCMARVVEGSADMRVNNALTEEEVAAGWVLTCQAVPTAPSVRVVYGYAGG